MPSLTGKRPGLQGPIDDAFTTPFLCVRGTGKAWNPAVQAWSDASLKRFAYEWHRYFRGELPVKDDTDVTEDDVRRCNLILFGDPGSNRWIARVLPKLPLHWTRDELQLGGERYSAADHVPLLIQPNPLADGALRRPEQRPHLPRKGVGVAELSALPAAGRLGGAQGRRQGAERPVRAAGGNRCPGGILRRGMAS